MVIDAYTAHASQEILPHITAENSGKHIADITTKFKPTQES